MGDRLSQAIAQATENEPFRRLLGIEVEQVAPGRSVVHMVYRPEIMDNIYGRAHGGAVFALIDEAFETASQTDGTIAVALNVNVTYVASPPPGTRLTATARKVAETRRTATYDIQVTDDQGRPVATCSALAYRTGKPVPFVPAD